jgi:hypothetical protein
VRIDLASQEPNILTVQNKRIPIALKSDNIPGCLADQITDILEYLTHPMAKQNVAMSAEQVRPEPKSKMTGVE